MTAEQPATSTEPVSPRIEHLRRELDAAVGTDRDAVLAAFWRELEASGAPLVEPSERPGHSLVTFVWRASSPSVEAVELRGNPRWRSPLASWLDARDFAREALGTRRLVRLGETDVWFDTSLVRDDLRMTYSFDEVAIDAPPGELDTPALLDPLNPVRYPGPDGDPGLHPVDPDWEGYLLSMIELPDAASTRGERGTPRRGELHAHRFAHDGEERAVWVYTPHGYDPAGEYPLVVLHDGWNWVAHAPIADVADGLIAAGLVPPLVIVMHESRDREELACDPAFVTMVADRLIPWCAQRYAVTRDPARTIVAGQSYGGLNAAYAAFERPDVFGNVLSQSGSFWFREGSDFDVEFGQLMTRYLESAVLPVRFHLDVGLLEAYMVPVNRHFRDVLRAKGYKVSYLEFNGDHTWACWRETVGEGLIALTAGWPRD